jgi:hypothetical protein
MLLQDYILAPTNSWVFHFGFYNNNSSSINLEASENYNMLPDLSTICSSIFYSSIKLTVFNFYLKEKICYIELFCKTYSENSYYLVKKYKI